MSDRGTVTVHEALCYPCDQEEDDASRAHTLAYVTQREPDTLYYQQAMKASSKQLSRKYIDMKQTILVLVYQPIQDRHVIYGKYLSRHHNHILTESLNSCRSTHYQCFSSYQPSLNFDES